MSVLTESNRKAVEAQKDRASQLRHSAKLKGGRNIGSPSEVFERTLTRYKSAICLDHRGVERFHPGFMDPVKAIILGIVQGLTEFLPVSSSGHLVIAGRLLDVNMTTTFAVAVHVGTLLSVVVYFWKRLMELLFGSFKKPMSEAHWMIVFILVATIPAVIVGFTLKEHIDSALKNAVLAGAMLIVTAIILLVNRFMQLKSEPQGDVGWLQAIAMGFAQAFAILPGVSRSGSTIAAGMISGVSPKKAAEFSFLMAIPVIAGGGLLELKDLLEQGGNAAADLNACIVGAIAAFLSGLGAIFTVLDSIKRGKFQYFAYYCLIVGAFAIIYFGFIETGAPNPDVLPVPTT